MRAKSLVPAVGAAVVIGAMAAGYGGMKAASMGPSQPMASSGMPSGRHTMPDGTVMGDSKTSTAMTTAGGHPSVVDGHPSAAASMVCGAETAEAVRRTFNLPATPHRAALWSGHVYRCNYALPGGDLELTVADLVAPGPGRAWFDTLRAQLPAASTITGMSNFGFPAYETDRGDVVFLKDDKTLWVNASGVPTSDLPAHYTRTEAAYQIASAVIGCWSE